MFISATGLLAQAGAMPLGLSVEQFAAASGTFVLAVVVLMLLRGDLVTKKNYEQTVKLQEGIIEAKNEEISRIEADRDLWRDVAADALNVSEALVGRSRG